jgi:hypothetical protein
MVANLLSFLDPNLIEIADSNGNVKIKLCITDFVEDKQTQKVMSKIAESNTGIGML